ncbi:NADH-ubiquinone/plastoquinone oxidoreductase chain 3 [Salinisphaera sp. PC39]|uniref:NADH-quinone oxidoreductase subunit A n=1 Tax=Salinisphaera sp. PC39 TaxID=1304156 RepID=UPI00333F91F9
MSPLTEQPDTLWPLLVYLGAVVGLILAMLGLSYVLGGRTAGRLRDQPFESGVIPVGDARLRFSAKFYLVAIFFVLFDLEVVFLFAWGIAATELGWAGYAGAMIFLFVLTVALVYEWRIGALDWAPKPPRRRTSPAPRGPTTA